ncbi:MAG: uracil-DNA glycosylase [Methanomassiliicoccales archaeon]|nr:uracil-DNA glycosylase [Methanomassiliicoccales archaeon]
MRLDPECTRCRLCQGRSNVVAPEGRKRSPIALVGEAPGEREDQLGRPFVGRAGKMLDRIMAEQGVERDEVLITNTVKCRPPRNRRPTEGEADECYPYLEQELKGKALVITLGKTASENLLQRPVKMTDMANCEFYIEIMGIKARVMPAFHPSAAMYNLRSRESLGRTMLFVRKELDSLGSASSKGTSGSSSRPPKRRA